MITGKDYGILLWDLLIVGFWILYDPARAFFGATLWVGILLFLLIVVPILFLLYRRRGRA